ncbi:MAG: M15 family metallopeptidase [Roseburia sp.]|nr:M15 family metallopeptidase [Roseburia sp.]MCM1097610.1 M15 family metallopeptidase [Ruminococcus flavefaciens]
MNRSKILQMLILLAAIVLIAGGLLRALRRNSMTLTEYANLNASGESSSGSGSDSEPDRKSPLEEEVNSESAGESPEDGTHSPSDEGNDALSSLTGAFLNASQAENRITLAEGFYYEPLSDELRRYITGISFPAANPDAFPAPNPAAGETDFTPSPEITAEELRYVHILHYDFDGREAEGELICNESVAADLTEIFYELFCNEYRLERVLLIEAYDGDENASMADNNSFCFQYREEADGSGLSRHAYGLAVDINPLYNPFVAYSADGTAQISPAEAVSYADRSLSFPYKIDESDLCYKLFLQHGFTWGGNWNHSKDYGHFQKTAP